MSQDFDQKGLVQFCNFEQRVHICKSKGGYMDGFKAIIVYSNVNGILLSEQLRKTGPFVESSVKIILKQLIQSLVALKEQGFSHNNISPETIFLSREQGQFRTRLFGQQQLTSLDNLVIDPKLSTLLKSEQNLRLNASDAGSASIFASPKKWMAVPQSSLKDDVQALGVLALALLHKEALWTRSNAQEDVTFDILVKRHYLDTVLEAHDISLDLRGILLAMLQFKEQLRISLENLGDCSNLQANQHIAAVQHEDVSNKIHILDNIQ